MVDTSCRSGESSVSGQAIAARTNQTSRRSVDAPARTSVIELLVRNHPGVMSHITGLFARRAFNLEAILCVPNVADEGETSTMLLLVADESRLEQVERQLEKLHDVLNVRHRTDLDRSFFDRLGASVPPRGAAAVPL